MSRIAFALSISQNSCVSPRTPRALRLIPFFQSLSQLQLEDRHGQFADASAPKYARSRIEDWREGGILRHCLYSGLLVACNPKRALRPAENAVRLARPLP